MPDTNLILFYIELNGNGAIIVILWSGMEIGTALMFQLHENFYENVFPRREDDSLTSVFCAKKIMKKTTEAYF